ncbi:MAG: SGNH/GDSL hydrolase family protein [Victivallales bacterium]
MKTREETEWCKIYWYDTGNSTLPRILLIGDSIVAGYNDAVAKLLKGRATVAYLASSKCVGDPTIYRELELVMNAYRFKLIHFNNGLHGFTTSESDYARGLADYVDAIESMSPESKLIWASSTPITLSGKPDKLDPEKNPRVCERNHLAAEIMRKRKIPVNDLYSLVLGRGDLSCGDGYHYNQTGIGIQAEKVVAMVAEAI